MRDLKAEVEKRSPHDRIVYIKAGAAVSFEQLVGIIDLIREPEAGGATQIGLVADCRKSPDSETPVRRRSRRGRRR